MELNTIEGILITGLLIMLLRITDVTAGTLRTISIVNGRTGMAFLLGFLEIGLWLVVISTVLSKIMSHPVLGLFHALGFALGNVIGIKLEKFLALGHILLRVISCCEGRKMAARIRDAGYAVTTFQGEGRSGPVLKLHVVCRRRDLRALMNIVREVEPDAFYITEQIGSVSKVYRPIMQPATGWRAIMKKSDPTFFSALVRVPASTHGYPKNRPLGEKWIWHESTNSCQTDQGSVDTAGVSC
jgi:uncharacterized protein YebE (UPF0316 family)